MAGFFIAVHAPRVAQPVGPSFGNCIFDMQERIVLGYGILFAFIGVIHIKAQYFTKRPGHILTRNPSVGIGSSIATGDIKHAIFSKSESSTIMAIRMPFFDGDC